MVETSILDEVPSWMSAQEREAFWSEVRQASADAWTWHNATQSLAEIQEMRARIDAIIAASPWSARAAFRLLSYFSWLTYTVTHTAQRTWQRIVGRSDRS